MFFGITTSGDVFGYLALVQSLISLEFQCRQVNGEFKQQSVFFDLPIKNRTSKVILLEKLAEIRNFGWQPSIKLNSDGEVKVYSARNGGGYTLEALLGILPNGRSEPDFMGWELKAYSKDKITLMTPEPRGGLYGEQGVQAFVRKFGHQASGDTLYFTGTHRANSRNETTGLTLNLRGFNSSKQLIDDVNGAVELTTDAGECAAAWLFADLMVSWNKKHCAGGIHSL